MDINTFPLPKKFFEVAAKSKDWEITTLVMKDTAHTVAVIFSYKTGATYLPTVIGMDYTYLNSHKIYKQSLYRLIERAFALGCDRVHMGFGAGLEKKKLNCIPVPVHSFVQIEDSFNAEFIRNYKAVSS
jgi:hypothetical protein